MRKMDVIENVSREGTPPPTPITSSGVIPYPVDPPESALSPRKPILTPPTVVGGDKLKKPPPVKKQHKTLLRPLYSLFMFGVRQCANYIKSVGPGVHCAQIREWECVLNTVCALRPPRTPKTPKTPLWCIVQQ